MQKNANQIFQRYEKKYVLSRDTFESFQDRIKDYMKVDGYGLIKICNVYYDTKNYDLIQRSLNKPIYKEKLRLRSYGIPSEHDYIFIEIKKKVNGIVYKRRVSLTMQEARNYLEYGIKPQFESQILREIDYLIQYYKPVKKMYIAYDRFAMAGKNDESIRITFDQNIRSRAFNLDLAKGDDGDLLFENEEVLMEIKMAGAYPMWLVKILSEFQLYPVSFSKYGNFYKRKIEDKNRMEKK
ncbi:polyphosphate polymerase domain-containing protein [Niameybacter massiliensis]|uniref:Polyphosphate polymerase domain-containing protein n=1 Tax=Holtiella tumoricola TaxID=3018743 RepID=A0AA42DLB6_9FIRM|nr:polyphosphate polymerase domain-containing protein [Holtiella tumoricola]MDA3731018.1 polyphosphate polymerase domain-containing protein [Holtiella tumoricola]